MHKKPQLSLLDLRHQAHVHIDRFWMRVAPATRSRMRVGVYKWLRRLTGLSQEDCHISKLDKGMCEVIINLCKQAEIGLIEGPRLPNGIQNKHNKRKKKEAIANGRIPASHKKINKSPTQHTRSIHLG